MVVSGVQSNIFNDWELWGKYAQYKDMTYIPPTVGNIYELKRYYTMNYDGFMMTEAYYALPEVMQNVNIFYLSNHSSNDLIIRDQ